MTKPKKPRVAERVAKTKAASGTNPLLEYHAHSAILLAEEGDTPSYEGSNSCDTSSEGSDAQDQHFDFQPLANQSYDSWSRQYEVPIPNTYPATVPYFPTSGAFPTTPIENTAHLPQTRPTATKSIDSSNQANSFPNGELYFKFAKDMP